MSEASRAAGLPIQGRVGTVVNGKWHIDARIGAGGMATVYAATHRNGHRAALKMLHLQLSRDEATRARFLREGYVGNAVGHPGVVRVQDDGVTEDGCAFLVLDLLEGDTIEARRERHGGSLPIAEILEVADQALDALAAAHENGIVHRDIKPDNVFLCSDGRVMLLDFGLAQMKSMQAETTKTGVTIGTPEFMAPEQAGGRRQDVDARSDIWGLGATLFTALTGKYVHDAHTLHEQLVATATRPARGLRELLPSVPASIAVVIDRALELDKKDRWADAREMQRALRSARAGSGEPEKVVAESLTMPAQTPVMRHHPSSGARPSGAAVPPPVPSSGRTLEMLYAGAPASEPTIRDAAPITLDSLPEAGGPASPVPITERLFQLRATGGRPQVTPAPASTAARPLQGPQTPKSPELGHFAGAMHSPAADAASPAPALAPADARAPAVALASATGSGPHSIIGGSGVGSHAVDSVPIHARGSGSILPSMPRASVGTGPQPSASMGSSASSNGPPSAVAPGPLSLRQRRTARAVVLACLALILLSAAAGAWVLLHR